MTAATPDPSRRGWPERLTAWDAPPVTEEQRRIIRAALRSGRHDHPEAA